MWKECIHKFLLLLAPLAPHISEELWERTGHPYSIHNQSFPKWDEDMVTEEEITLVVQVNGRLRERLQVPIDVTEDEAKRLAIESPNVQSHVKDQLVVRMVYVPGRLVNVVVR